MTITPTTPVPAGPAAPATGTPGDPAAAGDFLALVLQALTPTSGPGDEAGSETPGDEPADTTGDAPVLDPTAAGLVAPPGLAVQLASGATGSARAPGQATVAVENKGSIAGAAADARGPGGAAATALAAGTPAADVATVAREPRENGAHGQALSPDASADTAGGPDTADAEVATTPSAGVTRSEPTTPALATPSTPTPAPVGSASAVPVALASPATTAAGDVTPTQHVTRQVFPEVTSLVSRGNGTHRITLTLNPEALGEVRVVMTVRDGAVHVRLAAGHDAQLALRDGSSELTRLLEVAGASDSRVVVRDLPATSTSTSSTGSPSDLGTGGQRPQDQHAGTRAHQPATDGTHDGTRHRRAATGADTPRSNEPVTHTRTAGVDVTM